MFGFISRFFNKECQKCKDLTRPVEVKQVRGMEFVEIRKQPPKATYDEILIINKRGWKRICTYYDGKFYDHEDIEIKHFYPTHYCVLDLPEEIKKGMKARDEYFGT